jgi:hypothetical protein
MAQGRHEYVLGDNKFYIRRFDAFLSLKILGDIQKKFMAPMASLMEAQDPKAPQDTRMADAMKAIEKLSQGIDGDTLVDLTKRLLNSDYISVSIAGEPAQRLDEGMLNRATNNVADVVFLVAEVLKVNYAELFTQGRTLIGQGGSSSVTQ